MVSLFSPSLPKPLSSSSSIFSKPSCPIRRTQLRFTVKAASMYELLSVAETAGPEEIKAAYRRQARRWHPDACPSSGDKGYFAEQFMRGREAYEILSDPGLREEYDLALRIGAGTGTGNSAAVIAGGAGFRRSPARERGGFGDWRSQMVGLERKASQAGGEGTWGSRMRRCHCHTSKTV